MLPTMPTQAVRRAYQRAPTGPSAFERAASLPKHVVLLDTGEHGTNILEFGDPAVADVFRRSVLDFLATI
jgi:hypothetical protein